MTKILKNNLLIPIVLAGTLVSIFSVYALQSNDPPPFNSEASISGQQCTDLNSVKDCYFSLRINDYNNYQAYLGKVSTSVYDIQDPNGPPDGSQIKIEMCLGNGGGFGSGIACTSIVPGQYLVSPGTLEGEFGVNLDNLGQAAFVDVHIRIVKAGSNSVVFGSGRRVHIDSITVPTSKLQGDEIPVSWDSKNSLGGKFYFGGPISCNISNGGLIADIGSTSCTGTGAGTAQIEIQQRGPTGSGADYVSDIRTIQINPTPTPTPIITVPPGCGIPGNFILNGTSCTNGQIPLSWSTSTCVINYEIYERQWTTGSWQKIGTIINGTNNFTATPPQGVDMYYYIKSVNSFGSKDSNVIGAGSCVGGSTPTPTPLPGTPSCNLFFSPAIGNQGSPLSITVGVQNDADNLIDYSCNGSIGSGQLPPGTYSINFPSDSQSCTGIARNSSNQTGSCGGSFTVNGSSVTPTPTPTPSVPPGSVSDSCSVVVSTPPPPSATISASPNPVNYGSSSNISWSSSNTTFCSIPGIGSGLSGGPTSTGALTSNKTYLLTCQGIDGSTIFDTVTVNVNPPTATLRVRSNVGSGNWTISPTPTTGGSSGTGSNYISYGVVPGTAYTVTPGWISSGYNQPSGIYVTPLSPNETRDVDINYIVIPPPSVSNISITEPNYCVSGPAVTVGWTYSDPSGSPQSAYQVQITDSGNFNSPIHDTGKINSGSNAYFTGQGILGFNTTYRARVMVWNSSGLASSWSSTSNSWKTPSYAYPQVDFSWTANGIVNNPSPPVNKPVTFTDQTVFNGNPNGRQWSWTFGDGSSSTTQSPVHTYSAEGSYYVTLTATDNANQVCARTKGPLIIQKPIPKWREIAPR